MRDTRQKNNERNPYKAMRRSNDFCVSDNFRIGYYPMIFCACFGKYKKHGVKIWRTDKAVAEGHSNCPYCAIGTNANRTRIWRLDEMDADHVTAWSRGGETTIENCEMLCKSHNRAKGNR